MKMSKPGICCDRCFEMIASRSTSAARLWIDLCNIYSEHCPLKMDDVSTLRILELLGFVLTSEDPEFVQVKVNGKKTDSMGTYFCGGKCDEV